MKIQIGKIPVIIIFTAIALSVYAASYFTKSGEPKVTDNKTTQAINLLKEIAEIKIIENAVVKNGSKLFYTNEGENGDVITVSLRESFPDLHSTRIETFNVNIKTEEITVSDYATDNNITLEEWKKTVKERFE